MTKELVTFVVGDLHCAYPLEQVQQVVAMPAISPLPGGPQHTLGLIDVHGTPCPVVDLRGLLQQASMDLNPDQHLLILRLGDQLLAVPADRVERVLSAPITALPVGVREHPLVSGLAQFEDHLCLVLDGARLLDAVPVSVGLLRRLRPRRERVA